MREEIAGLLSDPAGITFLDRSTTVQLLEAAIDKMSPSVVSGKKFIVPLSPNSGNHVRTIIEQDLKEQMRKMGWNFCHSVSEVLGQAKPNDNLLLCDDNVSSGSQALAQFLSWFNQPREEWPPNIQGEAGIDDVALRANDIALYQVPLNETHLGDS